MAIDWRKIIGVLVPVLLASLLAPGQAVGSVADHSILARIEENATKLALIRAVSRDAIDPEIRSEDSSWGIAMARHCAEQTIREVAERVSENPTESYHKRALKILKEAGPAGMTKREFTRRTQFMDLHQRDSVLKTLLDADLISIEMRQARGRPAQRIKAI